MYNCIYEYEDSFGAKILRDDCALIEVMSNIKNAK